MWSFGSWHHEMMWENTYISEKYDACIFRDEACRSWNRLGYIGRLQGNNMCHVHVLYKPKVTRWYYWHIRQCL
jgi:hypothetical protein